MKPSVLRLLPLLLLLAGCKDLKIQTEGDKDSFRFGSPVHLWLTYKDDVVPVDAAGLTVTWSSDRDGELGSGADISAARLSAGKHKITVRGRYQDKKFETKRKLEVKNDRPQPQIVEPAGRSSYALGSPVRMVGAASDLEDGQVPAETLVWTSSRDGELGRGGVIVVNRLTPGVHRIELKARDRAGAEGVAKVELEVINKLPVATISAPGGAVRIHVGEPVSFSGQATDPDPLDGPVAVPADALEWHSDLDGRLGVGSELTTDRLRPGRHRVELRARDEFGAVGVAAVSVEVENRAPRVRIERPDGGRFTVADKVRFEAEVEDPDGFELPDGDVRWTSNRDGRLGTGRKLKTDRLSPGRHRVTCEATDRHGASASASVELTITNEAPEARITAPHDGDTLYLADSFHAEGRARDPEDGDLDGDRCVWSALNEETGRRRDLGTGRKVKVKVADLGFGRHRLELLARDDDGAESARVSIRITVPNREPRVTISTPAADASIAAGEELRLVGAALDPDRDRWAKDRELAWTAQTRDGATFALGTGRELTVRDLAPGRYRLVLTATDPDDDRITASAKLFITVRPAAGGADPAATPAGNGGATAGAAGALGALGE